MLRALATLCLLGFAVQQEPRIPGVAPRTRTDVRATNMERGEAEHVDLHTLAFDLQYNDKHVKTRGRLESLFTRNPRSPGFINSAVGEQPFYVLSAGHARVLAVPGYGFQIDDMDGLLGSEVAVRGIVRLLGHGRVDMAQYPDLPPLPDPSPELPRVSLTILSLSRSGHGASAEGIGLAKQIAAEPGRFANRKVTLTGLFRGRNLFGDLDASSQRKPDDWVLKDDDTAVWITGKKPEGNGFSLDPNYKGDTVRWLAVEGRAELWNGVVYLKASKILLTKAPDVRADPDSR